jgi:hypothetical protein
MCLRSLMVIITASICSTSLAAAQTPTPTPVDSNVAVTAYAQSRGQDLTGNACTTRGGTGCGGCYPNGIPPADPIAGLLGLLSTVNPEWQAIGPMVSGVDASLPPAAVPAQVTGTVGLSKSPGDDFPGTHISPDYNAEIIPDDNGRLATGNGNQRVEFEWEGDKFPLFAWPGEGDRMIALGRWIFDCGHPDPGPLGKCSNDGTRACDVDADCNSGGTCSAPAANYNYQSELHPPQTSVAIRNKSIGKTPATRADVYISADAGGAADRCTNTHLANATDVLINKACFLNHCSITTSRSCLADADCAKGEICLRLDPNSRLADINASNFEFDLPLPAKPAGAKGVKIKTKNFNPKGSLMPKATFVPALDDPTPHVHVVVPMATPLPKGMPNVFAQSISAAWQGDKTKLTHVQVKLTKLTINNPVKDSTPAVPRVCTNPTAGGLTTTSCTTNSDCQAGQCAAKSSKACYSNSDCAQTDYCTGASQCVGGVAPGWRLWGEVNGDWVEFPGLTSVGTAAPFAQPPFTRPSTPAATKEKFKFDEYLPADGTIHIKVTGRSLNCENVSLFGKNLKDNLQEFGLTAGASCLLAVSRDPGGVDITHSGTGFSTTTGSPVACSTSGKLTTCTVTSVGGDAGTCSQTTTQLCVSNADCPASETCNVTGGAFTLEYTLALK